MPAYGIFMKRFRNWQPPDIARYCLCAAQVTLAALSMQLLGFEKVCSLKLGLKGLNDEDYPMFNAVHEQLNGNLADEWLTLPIREGQRAPKH